MRIVFVHFGKTLPKFLFLNISRTLKQFPEHEVVLITNPECRIRNNLKVKLFLHEINDDTRELLEIMNHPRSFRNNFWFNTVLRFFAIEALQKFQEQETLHVESDVILSRDFPFKHLVTLEKSMAFPLVSRERGIASIVYFKDLNVVSKFNKFISSLINSDPSTTDMIILRKFYEVNPQYVQILPTLPIAEIDSFSIIEPDIQILLNNAYETFQGVFDGADLGIYLAGIDPRNNRGRRILRRKIPNNYVQIENLNFVFDQERQFINLLSQKDNFQNPVYNLHIHSKDVRFFNNSCNKMLKKRIKCSNLETGTEFIFTVFINAALTSLIRRFLRVFPRRVSDHV